MLKRAYLHKAALYRVLAETCDQNWSAYFPERYWEFEPWIDNDNKNSQQFVSVDKSDNVLGFFSAEVREGSHFIQNVSTISFENPSSFEFRTDQMTFIVMLFDQYKYEKIVYKVIVGSPHEKTYDKFSKRFGGRIVGVFENDIPAKDGSMMDQKYYELTRKAFLEQANKHIKRYRI